MSRIVTLGAASPSVCGHGSPPTLVETQPRWAMSSTSRPIAVPAEELRPQDEATNSGATRHDGPLLGVDLLLHPSWCCIPICRGVSSIPTGAKWIFFNGIVRLFATAYDLRPVLFCFCFLGGGVGKHFEVS